MKHIQNLEALPEAAEWLIQEVRTHRILAFQGEMGAGKTTFIQSLCKVLGVTQEVTSPSFALVNEYAGKASIPIYHFDFYRLDDPVEALDYGLNEYLDSGHWCLMEWPERVDIFLPDDVIWLNIKVLPDHSRQMSVEMPA